MGFKTKPTLRSGAHTLFNVILFVFLYHATAGQSKESITSVTVKDQTSCSCSIAFTPSITNATSCVAANGKIALTVSGGSGTYNFNWTNQSGNLISTNKDITNLTPGIYNITVSDKSRPSCLTQGYFEVGSDIQVGLTTASNTNCNSPSGAVTVTVSGGSGNFSFEWAYPDGAIIKQKNITGLKAGKYTLTVNDVQNGCSASKTTTIKNTNSLSVATLSKTDNSSCLSPNGAINITVTGGSGQNTFYWYNLSSGEYVSYDEDLAAQSGGEYSLYVVDKVSACSAYNFYTIDELTPKPEFTFTTTPNTNCSAPHNGSINLTPSVKGSYTFSWTDGTEVVSTKEDPDGLAPGVYRVTVTDLTTGCSSKHTLADPEPITINDESTPNVNVSLAVADNTDCTSPDGKIETTITGATASFICSWTGPNGFTSQLEDLNNLSSGTYVLHVTIPCSGNLPPVIEQNPLTAEPNSSIQIDLMKAISDPDGNLDPASIQISAPPISGATWSVSNNKVLSINYTGLKFNGNDQLKVKACDLLNACTEKVLSVMVTAEIEIVVYNAVAPNSTGDNKFMRIMNLPDIYNKVSIYNRWGDKVFEVENYDNNVPAMRFEGTTSNGKELPSGTYFYKIELGSHYKTLTGYLALKR